MLISGPQSPSPYLDLTVNGSAVSSVRKTTTAKAILDSGQSGCRQGAFAVFSPRTAIKAAAIYEDGANGGS